VYPSRVRRSGILTAIDVGTSKVCTILANLREGVIDEVLGMSVVPSRGMQKAVVVSAREVTQAIQESVQQVEQDSGFKIKSAYVGISGRHIKAFNNRATMAIARRDHRITEKLVKEVIEASQKVDLLEDRGLIHAIPQRYALDGQMVSTNPVGLHGYRLDVETHIITAGITFIQNLVDCVRKAGVNVMDIVSEPVADSEAVLGLAEKEKGAMIADIGCGTTDISIFKEGYIYFTSALPVAGYQLSRDLSEGLEIPFDTAEELKKKYASVIPMVEESGETILWGEYSLNYGELNYIIKSRIEEIFQLLLSELPRNEPELRELSSLVLCGGTANLTGIERLAYQTTGIPARIGRVRNIAPNLTMLTDPAYITGAGLLLWGSAQEEEEPPPIEKLLKRFFSQLSRLWFRRPRIKVSVSR
jgi:cell division protein FtsA